MLSHSNSKPSSQWTQTEEGDCRRGIEQGEGQYVESEGVQVVQQIFAGLMAISCAGYNFRHLVVAVYGCSE